MGNTEKGKGQQQELSCLLQNQLVQLLSELPGSKGRLCWKESSPPYCKTVLEDEQRCWPWTSRKVSVLISLVQCNNCFWGCSVEGCSDVCCGKMILASSTQNPFRPTQRIRYSWSPLGSICVWPCLMRSTSPSAQCYSHFCGLYLLFWFINMKEPAVQSMFQGISAEVYMWCSPSFLEVYRKKTWFSWPAKVIQQQLIMLFSTCVSIVDWWMEHKCGHVCHGSWTKLMWYASPVCHQWPLSWDVWLLCTACLPESWADGWKQLDHLTIANTPLNVTARGPQHCRSERTFHCLAAYEQSQRCELWPSWAEVRAVGEICRSDLELASTANAWPACGW